MKKLRCQLLGHDFKTVIPVKVRSLPSGSWTIEGRQVCERCGTLPWSNGKGKLGAAEYRELATYNAECSRGIEHTREFRERMESLQDRFGEHGHDAAAVRRDWR